VLIEYEGRLTDGRGHDIDPALLEPCPRCGKGRAGRSHGIRLVSGIDPAAI
jgi:hypothetical protein